MHLEGRPWQGRVLAQDFYLPLRTMLLLMRRFPRRLLVHELLISKKTRHLQAEFIVVQIGESGICVRASIGLNDLFPRQS